MASKTTPFDYAAQWTAEPEPEELVLPSGKKVLVRTPDLLSMARAGRIPDALTPIVERFIFEREATIARVNSKDQEPGKRLSGYAEFLEYVDVVVVGACVAPAISFAPRDGELPLEALGTPDRIAIWTWAEGLATGTLATFPDGAAGPDAGVQPVADVQEPQLSA